MQHVFDKPLQIKLSNHATRALGRDLWVVTEAFNYWLDDERTKRINIPAGYLTDGASVPKIFQGLFPPWGPYGQAAVVHDWLCEYLKVWDDSDLRYVTISRSEADNFFNDAMRVLGVKNTTRYVMWGAVRAYGHLYSVIYQQHDQAKMNESTFLLEHYRETGEWL